MFEKMGGGRRNRRKKVRLLSTRFIHGESLSSISSLLRFARPKIFSLKFTCCRLHFQGKSRQNESVVASEQEEGNSASEVEGKEREAYALLRELYQRGEEQRKPTLLMRVLVLEEILDVPEADRLPLDKAAIYRMLKGYRPIRKSENPDAIKAVFLRLENALEIPEDKRLRW